MILDATNKTIEAVLSAAINTTNPSYVSSYADHTTTTLTPGSGDGALNGTTAVTIVSAPGSSTQRQVLSFSIYNEDIQISTVTVSLKNNTTGRKLATAELLPYESLCYESTAGFYIIDAAGNFKTLVSSGKASSLLSPAHIGGSGGIAANYIAGMVNATALTTLTVTADGLWALPFVAPPRAGVVGRIAVYVTTGVAATLVRIGIYNSTSETNLYPNALLYDSGELSTATSSAIASASPALTIIPGRLYWAVLACSGAPTLRAMAVGGAAPIFGLPDAISGTALQIGLKGSRGFAALPDPFTASVAALTTTPPCIMLRYAS